MKRTHKMALKPALVESSLIKIVYGNERKFNGEKIIDAFIFIGTLLAASYLLFCICLRILSGGACRCSVMFDLYLDYLAVWREEIIKYIPSVDERGTTVAFLSPLVVIKWRSTITLFKWLINGVSTRKFSSVYFGIVVYAVTLFLADVGLHAYYPYRNTNFSEVLPAPSGLLFEFPVTDVTVSSEFCDNNV